MKEFRLKVDDDHLRVFAWRNPPVLGSERDASRRDDLFIYMFTNRKLINNMQSTLEVEILRWNDDRGRIEPLEETAEETPDLRSDMTLTPPQKGKVRKVRRGERQYLHHYITKKSDQDWTTLDANGKKVTPKNFYTDIVHNMDQEDDIEFWNKAPSVFKHASDGFGRIIFHGGSRAIWIFDL